ncbi:MAG: thioredoxin peroxidase, partial [Loktanella salsilacus]
MTTAKPNVGAQVEQMTFAIAGQDGTVTIGAPKDRWTMLFVYRGRHCPRCKRFLNKLNAVLPQWT